MSPRRAVAWIGATTIGCIAGFTCLPLLAGGSTPVAPLCNTTSVSDGTPPILGRSLLTHHDFVRWWQSTRHTQRDRLSVSVETLSEIYLTEAEAEGVRGDLAFAQAVLETGHFTSRDTAINNYAGIAHYDGARRGRSFTDPPTGVRAHIQLLKKYAAGNDTPLTQPDVSPNAGAEATTWGQLAGTWATSPGYWTSIERIYQSMLETRTTIDTAEDVPPAGACLISTPNGYALPVDRSWYERHPDWFLRPHHDYPAVDIPVPTGTPVYSITRGTVTSIPTGGRCGIGVVLAGDDGANYIYCHGQPGSQSVRPGDRVEPGQQLMSSASTGRSTGPHLHLGIRVGGVDRCPQELLAAVANGSTTRPEALPTAGCVSGTLS